MLNNQFYQKAKTIAAKFEKAKGDYKESKLAQVKQESLKEVQSLIKQYKNSKYDLQKIRQAELKEAKEKVEASEQSSFFEIIKDGKVDFDTLAKQEQLQRYFTAKFAQINSPQHLELAINELVTTGDVVAFDAFKLAYTQTNLPFLNDADNKYLRAEQRVGLKTENKQTIRAVEGQIDKLNVEYIKLTNPALHDAQEQFSLAQTNLQSAMGYGTDDVLNGLNQVFTDINGFGGEGIEKSSDRFF